MCITIDEVLEKNGLVITVDGELRFEKNCLLKRYYDGIKYYDDTRYIEDYDGDIYPTENIEDTHFEDCGNWYNRDYWGICEKCGSVENIDELHECADTHSTLCESCATECEDCGDWYENTDNMYWCEHDNKWICQSCYDDNYYTCDSCGDIFHRDNITWIHDQCYCDSCRDDLFQYCSECDEYVSTDEYDYDAECCYDCASKNIDCTVTGFRFIDYSEKPNPVFYGSPRADKSEFNSDMGVGFELEVTTIEGDSDVLGDKLVDIAGSLCYYKRDCSCHSGDYRDEIEIISHPMKYDYFMNEFPFDKLCSTCVDEHYVSHDYNPNSDDSCGFHLHFSRSYFGKTKEERERTYAKLLMLFDWCWNDIIKVSRRKESMLHWCSKNISRTNQTKKQFYKYCRRESEERYRSHDSRYVAINFTNKDTVEIRLCRGSLNPKALRAWADLMFNFIHKCRTLPATALYKDKAVFLEGIREETREYLNSRNAFVGC